VWGAIQATTANLRHAIRFASAKIGGQASILWTAALFRRFGFWFDDEQRAVQQNTKAAV
jgi:hypothetical protein